MKSSYVLSALALAIGSMAAPAPVAVPGYLDNCPQSYSTATYSSCPIWTMTFTNQYNVPAGQTGALVTATYTDTANCAPTTSLETYFDCGQNPPPNKARKQRCNFVETTITSSSCPIWTMTFTNQYNVPAGQTGALVTATYTDTANCAPTAVVTTGYQCNY